MHKINGSILEGWETSFQGGSECILPYPLKQGANASSPYSLKQTLRTSCYYYYVAIWQLNK